MKTAILAAALLSISAAAQAADKEVTLSRTGIVCITRPCPTYEVTGADGVKTQVHTIDGYSLGEADSAKLDAFLVGTGESLVVRAEIVTEGLPSSVGTMLRVKKVVEQPDSMRPSQGSNVSRDASTTPAAGTAATRETTGVGQKR